MYVNDGANRLGYSRVLAVNADGSKVQQLTARATGITYGYQQYGGGVIDWLADDSSGSVLMTRAYVPQQSTGTLLANMKSGLGVDRLNTTTLNRTVVEPARGGAADYISDQYGTVRLVGNQQSSNTGMAKASVVYFYRKPGEREWLPFGTYDFQSHIGFAPVAVDRDLDVVYGFERLNGRDALYRISLDGSMKRELLVSRDDVDVDGLIRIGRRNRVVGASYATDKRYTVFFDPILRALTASLSKALPGQPVVSVIDSNLDESRLLIRASSDMDPGRYYLYDKSTRKLGEVMASRPELGAIKLSPVKAVSYKAADGTMIPAYLTLPPNSDGKDIPAIVMPHGGPEARDEWGFDWLSQFFANRGYAVLQPNYRGSTGYGAEWFQKNGYQSWRSAIGDVNDAGRWLLSQGIAAPGKLAIVGWSYGGYAALQSSVLDPDLFKAIVAVAPVTDLEMRRQEARNFTNFALEDARIGHGPHVKEGSPAQNAEKVKAPVLMFHGDQDNNVGVGESRLMLSRLKSAGKQADLVIYPGLDHYLDDSKVRAELLSKSDAFLRASLGL